jgi:N-acyl homoserine lactone hydrolase
MMQIYALCCGSLEFDRHIFFPDHAPGTRMTIPVSSYLLIHPKGRGLFDTGVHRQAITDPSANSSGDEVGVHSIGRGRRSI